MDDYSFLNPVFAKFLLSKGQVLIEETEDPIEKRRKAFQKKLNTLVKKQLLSEAEVKTWVAGLSQLPTEKLYLIAQLQSEFMALRNGPNLRFTVDMTPESPIRRALNWTVIHVLELGLKGLDPWEVYLTDFLGTENWHIAGQDIPLKGLYRQCYWCGKLNYGISEPGKTIRKSQKYCHSVDCTKRDLSNPAEHMDCCLGQFGLIRRRYRERFRYQGKGVSKVQHQQQIKENFLIYCEERFAENLNKEQDTVSELSYDILKAGERFRDAFDPKQVQAFKKFIQMQRKQLQQSLAPILDAIDPNPFRTIFIES
jgi:hypothetical protein